jgi:hypothetical protein
MIRFCLAALALLLPGVALADVTAHYSVDESRFTVEVADSGDARVVFGKQFSIVYHDGIDYLVFAAPDGLMVTPFADLLEVARAQGKFPAPQGERRKLPAPLVTAAGTEMVGQREGKVWKVVPPSTDAGYRGSDAVFTDDPELAPIAAQFARLMPLMFDIVAPPGSEGMRAGMVQLLAKGTPLRME